MERMRRNVYLYLGNIVPCRGDHWSPETSMSDNGRPIYRNGRSMIAPTTRNKTIMYIYTELTL